MDDLRTPIGLFFALIGLVLAAVGVFSSARAPMTEANVNLWTGLSMLIFGGAMLWLARRAS